jgi:hypothetical protein
MRSSFNGVALLQRQFHATGTCADLHCAINTIQPPSQPYAPGTAIAGRLPPLTSANIGDSLSSANIDWAWYSGGWSNAAGNVGEPGWTNGTAPLPANAASTAPCFDSNSIPAAV